MGKKLYTVWNENVYGFFFCHQIKLRIVEVKKRSSYCDISSKKYTVDERSFQVLIEALMFWQAYIQGGIGYEHFIRKKS